jgi:hypothetical protein
VSRDERQPSCAGGASRQRKVGIASDWRLVVESIPVAQAALIS